MKIKNVTSTDNNQGIRIDLDFETLDWTNEQKEAVKKLLASSNVDQLADEERELIKNLKLKIGSDKPTELAGFMRFDAKFVRID